MIVSMPPSENKYPSFFCLLENKLFADGFCSLITTFTTPQLNYVELHTRDLKFVYSDLTAIRLLYIITECLHSFLSAGGLCLIAFILVFLNLEIIHAEVSKNI